MGRLVYALALAMLSSVLLVSLDAPFAAVQADYVADCNKGSGDAKIRGCSRIIKLGRLYGEPISRKNLAKAYKKRGSAYGMKGRYKSAIADFSQWIRLSPNDPMAYNNRGLAYESNRQLDKAIADYRKALQLRPGDKMATGRLKAIAALRKAGG